MSGKFEISKSKEGQYGFNLIAANGKVILTSVLYETKAKAEKGIKSVKTYASIDSRYKRKIYGKNNIYFIFKSGDGHTICLSEIYSSIISMEKGITSVKVIAPRAAIKDLTV